MRMSNRVLLRQVYVGTYASSIPLLQLGLCCCRGNRYQCGLSLKRRADHYLAFFQKALLNSPAHSKSRRRPKTVGWQSLQPYQDVTRLRNVRDAIYKRSLPKSFVKSIKQGDYVTGFIIQPISGHTDLYPKRSEFLDEPFSLLCEVYIPDPGVLSGCC